MPDKKIIVEISCAEVWKEISDYIDNDINPELRARLEYHFGRCHHCKAVLDGTKNVVTLIGDERAFDIPAELNTRMTTSLLNRIRNDRPDCE